MRAPGPCRDEARSTGHRAMQSGEADTRRQVIPLSSAASWAPALKQEAATEACQPRGSSLHWLEEPGVQGEVPQQGYAHGSCQEKEFEALDRMSCTWSESGQKRTEGEQGPPPRHEAVKKGGANEADEAETKVSKSAALEAALEEEEEGRAGLVSRSNVAESVRRRTAEEEPLDFAMGRSWGPNFIPCHWESSGPLLPDRSCVCEAI